MNPILRLGFLLAGCISLLSTVFFLNNVTLTDHPPLTARPAAGTPAKPVTPPAGLPRSKRVSVGLPAKRTGTEVPRSHPIVGPITALRPLPLRKPAGAGPIRFGLVSSQASVAAGQEFAITITAELLPISPSQLFFFDEQRSFRLRVLMPEGFIQTGGDYYEDIPGQPTVDKPVVITLSGHFDHKPDSASCFQLLHRPQAASANDLFSKASNLCIATRPSLSSATETDKARFSRQAAAPANQIGNLELANCSSLKGWVLDRRSPGVSQYVTLDIDGTRYGPILANQERPAIRDSYFPGHPYVKYGFSWPVPAQLNNGRVHAVKLFATATGEQLATTATQFGIGNLKATANQPVVGQPLRLSATSTTTGEPVTYTWRGPNSVTATGPYPVIGHATPAHRGIYKTVATTPSGCSATTQTRVVVTDSGCAIRSKAVRLVYGQSATGVSSITVVVINGKVSDYEYSVDSLSFRRHNVLKTNKSAGFIYVRDKQQAACYVKIPYSTPLPVNAGKQSGKPGKKTSLATLNGDECDIAGFVGVVAEGSVTLCPNGQSETYPASVNLSADGCAGDVSWFRNGVATGETGFMITTSIAGLYSITCPPAECPGSPPISSEDDGNVQVLESGDCDPVVEDPCSYALVGPPNQTTTCNTPVLLGAVCMEISLPLTT